MTAFQREVYRCAALLRTAGASIRTGPSLREVTPSVSTEEVLIVIDLKRIQESASDWFDILASGICGTEFFETRNQLPEVKAHLPLWARAAVQAGDFESCIKKTELWLRLVPDPSPTPEFFALLLDRAKAWRNVGRFEEALSEYRRVIQAASAPRDEATLSITLLLVGKLHGNYRGQYSLFTAFVNEAKTRLQRHIQAPLENADQRAVRNLAVCHDALGQDFRLSNTHRAEYHFLRAIRLNRLSGRLNGVSRSLAHISYLRFTRSATGKERLRNLRQFETALEDTRGPLRGGRAGH